MVTLIISLLINLSVLGGNDSTTNAASNDPADAQTVSTFGGSGNWTEI